MWYFRTPRIIFGEDSLSFLDDHSSSKILVVTDNFLSNTPILKEVLSHLSGKDIKVFSEISPEPRLSEILKGRELASRLDPDTIIGLGGGSSMDAAKILFALHEMPDLSPFDISPINSIKLHQKSELIEIPTTSGTGSECSWAAVFSDDTEERKNEIASPEIMADYAILDPKLVLDLPKGITVNTATDAITHAIEAYTSQWRNPYSDAMAEKALDLILNNLPTVLVNPKDINARNSVHIGASMAGISFSNSQIGLAHALGHALGAIFKTPHGESVGLYLPHVTEFNYEAAKDRYDKINSFFPDEYRTDKVWETIRSYLNAIGQVTNVSEAGIERSKYEKELGKIVSLASESTGVITNARDASTKDIENIARSIL
ncbi:NADH dependent alcohol dehydrogenase [Thermoplasma volcanium GSS1]|uniref:NADH dependent alcohol dehydrogenase n=1 Tax=Thermoplasma volcanium (strain ATCC 51530 / DSM 4299 / JCM 9571 / NBRC 15438 / GSS1) TaxID=273116 RepID=Q97BQ7_THEVO|nr:iron-containing alcohol dehydrogenase [Thermoplasma volcanium]BAB59540.1 NADH dependent alcohol dehydrogenase [Thermoplasma volcanium GSS1]